MGMNDGLASTEIRSTDFTATGSLIAALISGNTTAVGAGEIGNAELANNACSGGKVSLEFGPIGTGSPIAFGRMAQAGTGTTSTGSVLWVVFGRAFAAAPLVVVSPAGGTAGDLNGSPIAVGSFLCTSEVASSPFNWIAIGSGR